MTERTFKCSRLDWEKVCVIVTVIAIILNLPCARMRLRFQRSGLKRDLKYDWGLVAQGPSVSLSGGAWYGFHFVRRKEQKEHNQKRANSEDGWRDTWRWKGQNRQLHCFVQFSVHLLDQPRPYTDGILPGSQSRQTRLWRPQLQGEEKEDSVILDWTFVRRERKQVDRKDFEGKIQNLPTAIS